MQGLLLHFCPHSCDQSGRSGALSMTMRSCHWSRFRRAPVQRCSTTDALLHVSLPHRERQKCYRARLASSVRTHTLDGLPPTDATPDARRNRLGEAQLHCERQRRYATRHSTSPSVRTQAALTPFQDTPRGCERDGTRPSHPSHDDYARLSDPLSPHDPVQVDMPVALPLPLLSGSITNTA